MKGIISMAKKVKFDFEDYASKCKYAHEQGTEMSFYTHFENLMNYLFIDDDSCQVICNPTIKGTKNRPDFQVERNKIPILRIEGKPPRFGDIKNMLNNPNDNEISKNLSKQIMKYNDTKGMIIMVTDFKTIWRIDTTKKLQKDQPIPIKEEFRILNDDFTLHTQYKKNFEKLKSTLSFDINAIRINIMNLVKNIMPYVKNLKEKLTQVYEKPQSDDEKILKKYLDETIEDFQNTIFNKFTDNLQKVFIDSYVQVLVYGIFMGWLRYSKSNGEKGVFSLDVVTSYLPSGSLMQSLFSEIKNYITEDELKTIFDPIFECFNRTEYQDISKILDDLMNEFYSDFLELYDKEEKKKLGVVYTPKEIVNFMVNGIDYFLINKFKLKDGVLNKNVQYLDPSAGTMAYPCALMELGYKKIAENVKKDSNSIDIDGETKNKFAKWFKEMFIRKDKGYAKVFGFEILMAPYILGSLRILTLGELRGGKGTVRYNIDKPQVYLMNTLMDAPTDETLDSYITRISNRSFKSELKDSLRIREKEDIMVIFTNPPYNISSQNKGEWIENLVKDYMKKENLTREDGKPQMKEIGGFKSLKDDYIKFLRFAQWKIADGNKGKKGGIVSLVTNNFYIDGLTARGVRKEYMKAFDEIYIINLHGDWKKKIPKRANNMKDENVFDVGCDIAIIYAIRYPEKEHKINKKKDILNCKVHYTEVWGTKEEKLNALKGKAIKDFNFIEVQDNLDFEFTPYIAQDDQYQTFPYIIDIFNENGFGIVSAHDYEIIGYDIDEVKNKIKQLFNKYPKNKLEQMPVKSKTMWNPRKLLNSNEKMLLNKIYEFNWRGFEKRYIIYDNNLIARTSYNTIQYLLPHQDNLALFINRQNSSKAKDLGSSIIISNTFTHNKHLEGASGRDTYMFPLKINNSKEPDDYDNPKPAIHSNINKEFIEKLPYWSNTEINEEKLMEIGEEIFFYIYGVLFAPTYRENYKELLSMDFPRIPFPSDYSSFQRMSELGKEIAIYHLFEHKEVDNLRKIPTNLKDLKLTEIKIKNHKYANDKIVINLTDRAKTPLVISGVSQEIWDFVIGGIPQLDNWLKGRRYSSNESEVKKIHRGLTIDEFKYFLRMINVIELTLKALPQLDEVYNEIAEDLIEFE